MKLSRKVGTTSQITEVFIQDSSSSAGAGLTGLAFNTSGLIAYYKRNKGSASVAITLATISTIGTWETGGFKEVDATHMPGVYEFDPPNAALASGADSVVFMLSGAANMAPVLLEIELTAVDNQDGVHFGITALPNAAAAASGGLPTGDSTNSVKIQTNSKKNTALANFEFLMTDTSGTPLTGLTITATRSINGAAFGACTNAAAELSSGIYTISLAAADLNGNVITLRFTATDAKDTFLTILTTP